MNNKPKYIILHHSASPQTQTAKAIDDYHKSKWNFKSELGHYAGYQYIIEKSGNVFQARKDTEAGAHTVEQNMNYKSIGICVVGWYDDGHDDMPTKEQQASLAKLLKEKIAEYNIPRINIKFHRDYAPKSCPGYHITQDLITNLINSMDPEHEKNYKNIAQAVAKKVDIDYGENPNAEETDKILEKLDSMPVEIDKIVEKPVEVEKIVYQDKIVEVEKVVEKTVGLEELSITQLFREILNKILKS